MSKTEEETLHYLFGISLNADKLVPLDKGECMRAMEEYAKQEAIGFAEFCQNENYSYTDNGTWYFTDYPVSSNQLYDLYLKSKQP